MRSCRITTRRRPLTNAHPWRLPSRLDIRVANAVDEGWPDDLADLDEDLVTVALRLGIDQSRLSEIANEAEASFEALSKLS